MDATRLAFATSSFDVAFMLDFVEHVYQPDLEAALREVRRVLSPGGRLIIHTSPNRVFEETVYRHYVRNVHRAVLSAANAVHLKNRFFNQLVLPTAPLPPHDEYERTLHVNPQSAPSLRSVLQRCGFRVRRLDFWEPPADTFFSDELPLHRLGLHALDALRFLRPISRRAPLNRYFSNHIWVLAERP
jgi:SAM-dependent methyltransferase